MSHTPLPPVSDRARADDAFVAARDGSYAVAAAVSPLTRDLLLWLASGDRTYAETMDAWRTSCPRFPIWEDAVADGLVRPERDPGATGGQRIVLTDRGRAVLSGA